MRLAALTIFPMLAAAILVMVGGERLARTSEENRIAHDRERLLDFAAVLRDELTRLDSLYDGHLERLAERALNDEDRDLRAALDAITGIEACSVFRAQGQKGGDREIVLPARTVDLPEIALGDRNRPLNPDLAVTLEEDLLGKEIPEKGRWLPAPDGRHRVHYRQPQPGTLVAFLIDFTELQTRVDDHLATWLPHPTTPLAEAEEQVALMSPTRKTLASFGPKESGIAAAIIPERTLFGDFELRAWDRVTTATHHDPATIALATTLAALLIGSGFLLYFQQRRAIRLAAERVSFVNQVSHELGSPLTNLTLNLDLATDSLDERPNEARKRLGLVTEEVERLSRLVTTVLTFSHRERETLSVKPTPTRPAELTSSVVNSFRPALDRRGITIDTNLADTSPLLLDPDAFSQIIANLISNVEKYAAAGQWLGLSLREEKEQLIVEVADRGPGIPERARKRIFEPFERVHDRTSEGSGGTGLGLTIARELATQMEGDLTLLETAHGATFRLTLPAKPAFAVLCNNSHVA
jgi:signal transduction histidine kinase